MTNTRAMPVAGKTAALTATRKASAQPRNPSNRATCDRPNPDEDDVSRDLRLLRAILQPLESRNNLQTQARRPKTPTSNTTKTKPQHARTTSRSAATSAAKRPVTATDDGTTTMSATEQKKLAMNSFNTNLKVLSVFVKKRQETSQRNEKDNPIEIKAIEDLHASTPVRDHAECACLAIDLLRHLSDSDPNPSADSVQQREQGAVLLLEKLITLNIQDLATSQASKIHEQYWKRRKPYESPNPISKNAVTASLHQWLAHQEILDTKQAFDYVCSFQSQILRLTLLQGPTSVTSDLIDAVSIDHEGSPAAVVKKGLGHGFLSPDRASQNLTVISQALSKLSTKAMRADAISPSQKRLGFKLAVQSLLVRVLSLSVCQPTPGSQVDLWSKFERDLRLLFPNNTVQDQLSYNVMQSSITQIKNSTSLPLPSTLTDFLAEVAEANHEFDTAVTYLEDMLSTSSKSKKFYLLCRIATIRIKMDINHHDLQTLVDEIHKEFSSADGISSAGHLLIIVRLRKALVAHMTSSADAGEAGSEDHRVNLYLQLLFNIFAYCSRSIGSQAVSMSSPLTLATLKTLEALIDAEHIACVPKDSVEHNYAELLQACYGPVQKLCLLVEADCELSSHASALVGVKIKISNVLWRAHTRAVDMTYALELAQESVKWLDGASPNQLSSAALGPRLEKLASMLGSHGEFELGTQLIRRAIDHYISVGALNDAVEASLAKRSAKVWTDTDSIAHQLGRALQAHAKLAILSHETGELDSLLVDDASLPELHRAVLLEQQICNIIRKHSHQSLSAAMFEKAVFIINLADGPEYHVWRMRFVAIFVHLTAEYWELAQERTANYVDLLQTILKQSTHDGALYLNHFEFGLAFVLQMQSSLLSYEAKADELSIYAKRFLRLLEDCRSPDELEDIVEDSRVYVSVLKAFIDQKFVLREYRMAAASLQVLIYLLEHTHQDGITNFLFFNCRLVQCYLRLQDMKGASQALEAAKKCFDASRPAPDEIVEFHMTKAECNLSACGFKECWADLRRAAEVSNTTWLTKDVSSSRQRIRRDATLARGALLASKISQLEGFNNAAARYARQAAKISMSIWMALEKHEKRDVSAEPQDSDQSNTSALARDMAKLSLNTVRNDALAQKSGVVFWPYLELHVEAIHQTATRLVHAGLVEDAFYFLRQLENIHFSIRRIQSLFSVDPLLALLTAKCGRSAEELIFKSRVLCSRSDDHQDVNEELLTYAEAAMFVADTKTCKLILPALTRLEVHNLQESSPQDITQPRQKAPSRRRAIAPKQSSKSSKILAKQPLDSGKYTKETYELVIQQIHKDRRKALETELSYYENEKLDIQGLVVKLPSLTTTSPFLVHELFALSKLCLRDAEMELCADSMQSVLRDSAVALPFRSLPSGRHGRVSLLQAGPASTSPSLSKPLAPSSDAESTNLSIPIKRLQTAHELATILLNDRREHCSTDMLYTLVEIEARISLLLTTLNQPFAMSSTELVLKAGYPQDLALSREIHFVHAESATQARECLSLWPSQPHRPIEPLSALDPTVLKKLPESWSIISVALADLERELLISKVTASMSPFLVRIPLRRANEGEENVDFDFASVHDEIKDIIEHANASAHDERSTSDKKLRAEWHADRESLDEQLGILLQNIESVWLGGFRGIFSPQVFNKQQMLRFRKALTKTLEKHLPSRRKADNMHTERVELHDHILEMFLGLEFSEGEDIDDAIMDLLYFVVDILQFSGELNAYDEVDWDEMVVDVLSALQASHATNVRNPSRHTILILDKQLECFPWEAMPCLSKHPVSRMPSLGSVFERLAKIEEHSTDSETFTISLSDFDCSYILNPSGDLVSTQTLFEPILKGNLPQARHTLVNSPPSQDAFKTMLISTDMLLYFGHGSGAQYIRPRVIRSLQGCAVTFLFGCSSVEMVEHGVYESTGMPRAYMLGHSPAVVGCLWDVTDREIDRVALKTLSEWGLIDKNDPAVKEGLRRKGRKNHDKLASEADDLKQGKRKTLVEAVRTGRDATVLKYLCGAAVVVYGVPVVLTD